ncbi:glycosyltransferase family 1 protein [Xylariomycetidae sp. FL0641]|nr:glycosyltransferase family 1 protein [Xylariomycetidae sp. FL0641]
MATTNQEKKKPLLVFVSTPMAGHVLTIIRLAHLLIQRGYDAVFLTSAEFKDRVEKIGAEYYECSVCFPPGVLEAREKIPIGPERSIWDLEHVFLAPMPSRSASMRALLEMVRERDPDRPVIIMNELMSMAPMPFMHGAPLPKGYAAFPKVINLNVLPVLCTSDDTAPCGPGLPPDATPAGRTRNRMLHAMMLGPGSAFSAVDALLRRHLRDLGCTAAPAASFFDAFFLAADTTFQLSSPSMDYPRSDLPLKIRYAGALPPPAVDAAVPFPPGCPDLRANGALGPEARKKVVLVTQGTLNVADYSELIEPTLAALAPRDDTLVVAILGVRGAALPARVAVPANAAVLDYAPYDQLLPHADALVFNAGYGGYAHAAVHGVPVVVAGVAEDKAEVAARAEHAGLGLNLRTQRPASRDVAAAVARVLREPAFARRAARVALDNRDMDPVHLIDRQIREYAEGV